MADIIPFGGAKKLYTYNQNEFDAAEEEKDEEKMQGLKNAAHKEALVVNARVDRILASTQKMSKNEIADKFVDLLSVPRKEGQYEIKLGAGILKQIIIVKDGIEYANISTVPVENDNKTYVAVVPSEKLGNWKEEYLAHPETMYFEQTGEKGAEAFHSINDNVLIEKLKTEYQNSLDRYKDCMEGY